MTTGEHQHCFCNKDTGGNIVCCRCGVAITSCDKCVIKYCVIRSCLRKKTLDGAEVFIFDCPLASPRFYELKWRTPA